MNESRFCFSETFLADTPKSATKHQLNSFNIHQLHSHGKVPGGMKTLYVTNKNANQLECFAHIQGGPN